MAPSDLDLNYHPALNLADLVVVERLQTHRAVIRLSRLGRVTPQFGLTIHFGLEGGHSLQDVLLGKELQDTTQQEITSLPPPHRNCMKS